MIKMRMLVINEGKEELREVDRYEIDIDGIQMPRAIPKIRQNEEILRTFDGETIIIKKL